MHRPIERQAAEAPAAARQSEPAPSRPAPSWTEAGRSVEGRPIETLVVGDGPRRVLWVGGIHGNEREGKLATEELPTAFADAKSLAQRITLTVVRDLNPDGSAARRRGNAQHIDLNRNFPASNFEPSRDRGERPLDQPESQLLHDLILELRPDLVVVCHSTRDGFINYDGPSRAFAERFHDKSGYPVVESDALHSTPGSLGSWVGRDLGIPILTLEYPRGLDAGTAWVETRDAILAILSDVAAAAADDSL